LNVVKKSFSDFVAHLDFCFIDSSNGCLHPFFFFNVHLIYASECEDQDDCTNQADTRKPEEQTLVSLGGRVDLQKRHVRVLFGTQLDLDLAKV